MRIWVYIGPEPNMSSRTMVWVVGPNNEWSIHISTDGVATRHPYPDRTESIVIALSDRKNWRQIV